MLKKAKTRMFAIALIAIVLTLCAQGSLSYYSTVGKAANVVTSGNVRMIIHERTDAGTEFPQEGVYVIPGDIVSKRVSIESDCGHPFYLRVKIVYGVDSKVLSDEDCFKLNINKKYWEYHDGWYYYTGIVKPGETTPDVFSHVEIVGAEVDNQYIGKTLTLSVLASAVQSENNPLKNGKTYTASGWPKEEGSAAI